MPSMVSTLYAGTFGNCASLVLVHLPANLIAISLDAFEGCPKLSTVEAPYLSTTTLNNNIRDGFKNWLNDEGFLTRNPKDIYRRCRRSRHSSQMDMYYNWKIWARMKYTDGRLPLFTAAARSLKWSQTRQIFNSNMPVINEIDVLTGLPLFMLAAAGPTSDIESVYNLLREYPSAMMLFSV